MTGVLNENMAANHLILISLCSGETADTRGETCGEEELEVDPGGARQGKNYLCVGSEHQSASHSPAHSHLHVHTHSESQWSRAFSPPYHMKFQSMSLDGLLGALNMELLSACKYCI